MIQEKIRRDVEDSFDLQSIEIELIENRFRRSVKTNESGFEIIEGRYWYDVWQRGNENFLVSVDWRLNPEEENFEILSLTTSAEVKE